MRHIHSYTEHWKILICAKILRRFLKITQKFCSFLGAALTCPTVCPVPSQKEQEMKLLFGPLLSSAAEVFLMSNENSPWAAETPARGCHPPGLALLQPTFGNRLWPIVRHLWNPPEPALLCTNLTQWCFSFFLVSFTSLYPSIILSPSYSGQDI